MQPTKFFRRASRTLAALVIGCAMATPVLAQSATGDILTSEEAAYDCKKINGRMQLLILQIRDYPDRNKGSLLARGIQGVTVPIIGGTRTGLDPDARYQLDVMRLQAFNARLSHLKCPTFDLEAELKARDVTHTPKPQRPAR